jgi:pilus assembly protein CpaB
VVEARLAPSTTNLSLFQAGGTPVRNWRVLTAVAAVVLAAAASVLAYTYLTQADARAQDKTELVDALVARNVIPKGTPGDSVVGDHLLVTKRVPRDALPDSVLTDDSGLKGLIASGSIAKGQFVVRDSFVSPSQVDGFSTVLKDGKQAISFTVDTSHGVAGFIQPNDSINVLYSNNTSVIAQRPHDGEPFTTGFLLPGMRVLAVGRTTASTPAPAQNGDNTTATTAAPEQQNLGLITVEATPRQAEQLAQAMNLPGGILTLTLNPPNFDAKGFQAPTEIVDSFNLYDQDLAYLRQIQGQLNNK